MTHAGAAALDALGPPLVDPRTVPGPAGRKRGAFYRKSSALHHSHDDPAGLFADIERGGAWRRRTYEDTP